MNPAANLTLKLTNLPPSYWQLINQRWGAGLLLNDYVATTLPAVNGRGVYLSRALYGYDRTAHYKRVRNAEVSTSLPLDALPSQAARDHLIAMGEQRFFLFRSRVRSPLGALVFHEERTFKGKPLRSRPAAPTTRDPLPAIRPEILAEWHALMDKWDRFSEVLEQYPGTADHFLRDIFVDEAFEPLIKARDIARIVAAQEAARSAVDEIAAEFLR